MHEFFELAGVSIRFAVIGRQRMGKLIEVSRIKWTTVIPRIELCDLAGAALEDSADARAHGRTIKAGIQRLVPVVADEGAKPAGAGANLVIHPPEHSRTNHQRFKFRAAPNDLVGEVQEKFEPRVIGGQISVGVNPGRGGSKKIGFGPQAIMAKCLMTLRLASADSAPSLSNPR